MNTTLNTELWKQFGASLDMFENAITKCPPELWAANPSSDINVIRKNYWYIAFHTLFFLDYYLDKDPGNFKCPEHFSMTEAEMDEKEPDRIYTKAELLDYVNHCRQKCRNLLNNKDFFNLRWVTDWRDYSMFEMQLYNMRHVQHHTGQLNLLLGKIDHNLPIWVSQTKVEL